MMTTPTDKISFIMSQKGKKMLNINNFIFKLNKTTSTTKYYRCEDSCCTVTARTDLEDIILNVKSDHCHPPEPEEIQIRTFKQVSQLDQKTKKTLAIQHRIDTLYIRYGNDDINANELLDGLSYVVAKNIKSKRK
ncbi:unnamed protein product [Rotaria sp. Silwood2]|nr:unnamed protein product [Rotaria sp. Silwood2]